MTAQTLYSGTTHNHSGPDGFARSADGSFSLSLPEPHPTAEYLFGAAWSACYQSALGIAAAQRKVTFSDHPSVDATIEMTRNGNEYQLNAKLDVTIPGVDPAVGRELVEAAHQICPYSKAVHGNIEVESRLVETATA